MGDLPDKEGKNTKASLHRGPYSPPLQTEAERTDGGEPMAVANDKRHANDEGFRSTTQSKDAYDPDVARRWETVPGGKDAGKEGGISDTRNPIDAAREAGSPEAEKPETAEMVRNPPGYGRTDARGYKQLKWGGDEHEEG